MTALTSAEGRTVVTTGGVILLVELGSRIGLPAEATLVRVAPLAGAVTVTMRLVAPLGDKVARLVQSTWLPLKNPPAVALTKVNAAGKLSVTDKPLSGDGPRFVTVIV